MASLVSKRQQAKNEKALQELISNVPGNNRCADCAAPNPGWASWNLGIFLCMRCAALHRKLGTHISKVKSLSMDSWNADQVDTMKRVGNTASNRTFNPQNVKPSIPVDIDEADGAIERFIRQKYEQRAFISGSGSGSGSKPHRLRTASISSDDQPPPPLPPKPGRKFGFSLRSSSSTVSRSDKMTPPISPVLGSLSNASSSPAKTNKQSRVLGSTVGNHEDDFDAKLATLRDMGFRDTRRNSSILKSMNGNIDRTVEQLVRIAETSRPPSGTITPVSASSAANSNGLSVTKTRPSENHNTNPFDALDHQPLPQRSATMPVHQSLPPSQPLAPHLSYPPPAMSSQYQLQGQTFQSSNPFQQTTQFQNATPADPWSPQRSQSLASPSANPWLQQQNQFVQTPQAQTPTTYAQNPNQSDFFSQPVNQYQSQSQPPHAPSSTFAVDPQRYTSPSNPFQQPFSAPSAPPPNLQQAFYSTPQSQVQQQYQQTSFPTQPTQPSLYPLQTQQPPPPARHDKSSILALYNQPFVSPSQPLHSLAEEQQQTPQRSATMPVGSMNPFAVTGSANGVSSPMQGQQGHQAWAGASFGQNGPWQ
ncbi:ArfGap-domain-containing protein [Myriangium duriaei CBS 260.36]|uniref:ArfGap-domain-containing protein n=1 Tax=Myriangium duriaei CBS 260.36 TaxID=1168546 RepID=A0A9P4JEH5_9PEZI|nr:ArfGap-domain-containing protein [Myriangium duriaei CBS 260.36]